MIQSCLLLSVVTLVASSGDPAKKIGREKLQGEWVQVSVHFNGRPEPVPKRLRDTRMVFVGDKVIFKRGNSVTSESGYDLDLTRRPHVLIYRTVFDGGVVLTEMAYSVDGDRLTICWGGISGNPAPTELRTVAGDGRQLCVWRRCAKPKTPTKPAKSEHQQ